jgi:hypothetical protein
MCALGAWGAHKQGGPQEAFVELMEGPFLADWYEALSTSFSSDLQVRDCRARGLMTPVADDVEGCGKLAAAKGAYVVVQRGKCTFMDKAVNARTAGAGGLVIVNGADQTFFVKDASEPRFTDFPVVMLSRSDGTELLEHVRVGAENRVRYSLRVGGKGVCAPGDHQEQGEWGALAAVEAVVAEAGKEVEAGEDPGTAEAGADAGADDEEGVLTSLEAEELSAKQQQQQQQQQPNIRELRLLARRHGRREQREGLGREGTAEGAQADEDGKKENEKSQEDKEEGKRPPIGVGLGGRLEVSWYERRGDAAESLVRSSASVDYLTLWSAPTVDMALVGRALGAAHGQLPTRGVSTSVFLSDLHAGLPATEVSRYACGAVRSEVAAAAVVVVLSHMDVTADVHVDVNSDSGSGSGSGFSGGRALSVPVRERDATLDHFAGSQSLKGRSALEDHVHNWAESLCGPHSAVGLEGAAPAGLSAMVVVPTLQARALMHRMREGSASELLVAVHPDDSVFVAWDRALALIGTVAAAGPAQDGAPHRVGPPLHTGRQRARIAQLIQQELHPDVEVHAILCYRIHPSLHTTSLFGFL